MNTPSEQATAYIDSLLVELRDQRERLGRARALLLDGRGRAAVVAATPRAARPARTRSRVPGQARPATPGTSTLRAASPEIPAPETARPEVIPPHHHASQAVSVPADGPEPDRSLAVDRREMLDLIADEPGISVPAITARLGYDPAAIERILARMREQGEVRSVIVGNTPLWSIISEQERDSRRMSELQAALTGSSAADGTAEPDGSSPYS